MTRATPLRRHVSARRRQLQAKRRTCKARESQSELFGAGSKKG
jgi:hypothetical protein